MEKLCKRKVYQIINAYYKNIPFNDICLRFGLPEDVLNSIIKSFVLKNKIKKVFFEGFTYDIVTLYEKGLDKTKIANKYNTTDTCIRMVLKNYYENDGYENNSKIRILAKTDVYRLVNMFYNGVNLKIIMEKFEMTENEIYDTLDDFFKDKKSLCGIIYAYEMINLYEQGIASIVIAEKFSISPSTVKNRIDDYYSETKYIDDNIKSVNKSKNV